MKNTLTVIFCMISLIVGTMHVGAVNTEADSAVYHQLYKDYIKAYDAPNKEEAFYEYSKKLQEYFRKEGRTNAYYQMRMNEVLYETGHNHHSQAIELANKMLEDMRAESFKSFYMVYTALGTIYESCGNYRMAGSYFDEALKSVPSNDTVSLIDIYQRIAYLNMFKNPDVAEECNQRFHELCKDRSTHTEVYMTIEGIIYLCKGNREGFNKIYNEYRQHRQSHQEDVGYGELTFEIIHKVMEGNYDEAIKSLESKGTDMNELENLELKKHIYLLRGDYQSALKTADEKAFIVDTLNANMLFDNINQINTKANIYALKRATAKKMERMAITIIVLSFLVIIVLSVWLFRRQKMRQHLLEKNEQLKTALEMAEESDRMKTQFVRQVSHEVRTPLNAINGFNQVLNESGMPLTAEERQDLVERIKENSKAITNIIDELLNLSEQESAEYYAKNDDIRCNKVFADILYRNHDTINPFIELKYTTEVINRFTIRSNEQAVTKILDHLVQNAIKFTNKGHIEVHCRQSDDQQESIEVSVTDTGRGISKEMQSKIFEQFFKIDHFQQGMGLGLTVSKKIAQKLGGDLTLDDSYTKGSRFVLTLPIK